MTPVYKIKNTEATPTKKLLVASVFILDFSMLQMKEYQAYNVEFQ